MSIWCSQLAIGYDVYEPDEVTGEPITLNGECGEVRSYANGWSNHYPTTDGDVERPACIETAIIPEWCVPGHEEEFGERLGPWIRLDVYSYEHNFSNATEVIGPSQATVVLDEVAVISLVEDLQKWLGEPKAYPKYDEENTEVKINYKSEE